MHDAPEAGDGLVTASLTRPGGTLRADIRLAGSRRERIGEVLLSGDVFVSPARTVLDLEAALRGLAVGEAGAAAVRFLTDRRADLMGLAAEDFGAVIDAALRQLSIPVDGYRLRRHLIGPPPGAAPTLVFLHDALGCARLWRDIPHRLVAATGCGALVYDRRGSGDSDPLSPPFSRTYIAEEALQVLPQVLRAAGVEDAILIGHSDGGTIALAFAGAYPAMVRGVIAESAHLFCEPKTLGTIRGHIEDFEHGDLKQRLARHHGAKTEMLFRRLVEAWTAAGDSDWGVGEWLARIRCPVLAIHGDDDEFFTDAQPQAIRAALRGPLRLVRLADCGHVPHHQAREPALRAMRGFVLGLRRATSA